MQTLNLKPLCGLCCTLAVLILSGCGGGGSNGGSSTSTSSPSAPTPQLFVSAATPSGLTATLAENTASIPVGGNVTYTVTLTNNTTQPITYQKVDSSTLGGTLQIMSASGQTVFPPSGTGGGVTSGTPPVSVPATLAPGQSSSASAVQGGVFSSAGSYAATVTVTLISGSASATSTSVGPLTITAH